MSKGSTSSGSSGYNYNTSTNDIPQWVTDASQSALSYAQAASQVPYESLYDATGGQLVANLSPYTYQGWGGIENMQGMTTPGYQAAENVYSSLLGQAAPITADQLTGLTNALYGNYQQNVMPGAQSYYSGALGQTAGLL